MSDVRLSTPGDIPALRELWTLAFGDSGAYMDNFFQRYYRPERVLVLEDAGVVRSMTAWFDTTFVVPGKGEFRAAYLYAVATHPDCRGKGLAARLLSGADDYFHTLGIPAVTTVPAQPSLHQFFGSNGFRECFCHNEIQLPPSHASTSFALEPISPQTYTGLREVILGNIPHIQLPVDAVTYQAGCSVISGGNLYAAETELGTAILCTEGMADGSLLVKELLGCPEAQTIVKDSLHALLPNFSGVCRFPGETIPFGMLKWLDPSLERTWDWSSTAYLGLAFD